MPRSSPSAVSIEVQGPAPMISPASLSMDMVPFRRPTPTVPASAPVVAATIDRLRRLAAAANAAPPGGCPGLDVRSLPPHEADYLNDVLGQGEVSAQIEGDTNILVQETAFAGVWRLIEVTPGGRLIADVVEVGAIPRMVSHRLETWSRRALPGAGASVRPEVEGVLAELRGALAAYDPAASAHIVTLTLLPIASEGIAELMSMLGVGPCVFLSRGYGNCRVTATEVGPVWWVQYFNREDRLILNTLEVVMMPDAVLATGEDLRDSAARLRAWAADLEAS